VRLSLRKSVCGVRHALDGSRPKCGREYWANPTVLDIAKNPDKAKAYAAQCREKMLKFQQREIDVLKENLSLAIKEPTSQSMRQGGWQQSASKKPPSRHTLKTR
jgi:hypothetical protein